MKPEAIFARIPHMLKIRLSRTGKKHAPHYKVVVAEVRSKRDGKIVAQIGHWHPRDKQLVADRNAYQSWITRGAAPSLTVRKLFSSENSL